MAMNIKNKEAHRLAAELAGLLGVSMTEAVTRALRDALERVKPRGVIDPETRALVNDMQRRMKNTTGISVEDLYDDETGLPR